MKHARILALVMLAGAAATASAQQPRDTTHRSAMSMAAHTARRPARAAKPESQAQLKSQAKISEDSARTVALARVKGGTVHSSELTQHGRWPVYEVEVQQSGKSGYTEVDVNALSGKVISRRHETAKQEAREEKAEAKSETKTERKEDRKAERKEDKKAEKHEVKAQTKPAAKP